MAISKFWSWLVAHCPLPPYAHATRGQRRSNSGTSEYLVPGGGVCSVLFRPNAPQVITVVPECTARKAIRPAAMPIRYARLPRIRFYKRHHQIRHGVAVLSLIHHRFFLTIGAMH